MKFILVVFLLTLNPQNDDLESAKAFSKQYSSLEECNLAGNNFRQVYKDIPKEIKSVSTCVPVESYNS